MQTPLIDRRQFLKAAGIGFLSSLAAKTASALQDMDAVFASGCRRRDGSYCLALIGESGNILSSIALPDRAHGLTHCAFSNTVVAFARRPGTFAAVIDRGRNNTLMVIASPEGRHFYGHGCFSPDGRLLYASENDFDNAKGMIGIYDATDGFRRIGEFDAFGIGTHDMVVSDDGRKLIIANGGIETHPDFGRTKLNLDRMEPSLVLIDAASGSLIEKHVLPPALCQLSIRHVALTGRGDIWFACQYEGPRNDLPPLVGRLSPGSPPVLVDLPSDVAEGLANYVGAIAVNRHENLVGITSPKGGTEIVIDAASNKVVRSRRVTDAAGIAPARSGFAVSSYRGGFGSTASNVAWDQHIERLI